MIASINIVDVPPGRAVTAALRRSALGEVAGLDWAESALVSPLAAAPRLRRAGLFGFWQDEDALESFLEDHPAGRRFSGGLHARLRPLRAHGSWPGLPVDVPSARSVPHEGPVVVLTMGYLRATQTLRFLRASRPAEKVAVADPAMVWGTAAARPPFVATVSIWRSGRDASTYAYGRTRPQHHDAVEAKERKDFQRLSAFIRFAPLRLDGGLGGRNPLAPATVAALHAASTSPPAASARGAVHGGEP